MEVRGINRNIRGIIKEILGINTKLHRKNKKSRGTFTHTIPRNKPYPLPYLNTLKYLASGWANTIAETDASGSIIQPSVN